MDFCAKRYSFYTNPVLSPDLCFVDRSLMYALAMSAWTLPKPSPLVLIQPLIFGTF